nr:L-threonylcarbamoyladenylate synthase [Oscillochloris trichoides]
MIPTRTLPANTATIQEAATILATGGLVAFPTETVYGLGADALNPTAVGRIFAAKGRPAEDPLIVHLADLSDLARVTPHCPPVVAHLAAHCWPGPLTLVLPRGPAVPYRVTAGLETVAVRVPAHPVARALIAAAGTPIAAPSANRFGHTSPTTAAHVLADLDGRIEMVLDGGPATLGVESTVLDLSAPIPTLLRPGGVSLETLRDLLGEVALGGRAAPTGGQIAPGLLDRHYAPDNALHLCIGAAAACQGWLYHTAQTQLAAGRQVGLLIPDDDVALFADLAVDIEPLGPTSDPLVIAARLYAALRALDARQPDLILARDVGDVGIARAIRDRLTRAAAGRVEMV